MNLSQIYECRNWETEHYNSVLKRTVSFLEIHQWELDIYIGFSPALHLQCDAKEKMVICKGNFCTHAQTLIITDDLSLPPTPTPDACMDTGQKNVSSFQTPGFLRSAPPTIASPPPPPARLICSISVKDFLRFRRIAFPERFLLG